MPTSPVQRPRDEPAPGDPVDPAAGRTLSRGALPGCDHARGAGAPLPHLPLLLVLLFALPSVLFALITWQVVAHGPLLRTDARLSHALVRPDRAGELLSDLGNMQIAVPVLAVALGYVARRGRRAGAGRWWLPPAAGALVMILVPLVIVPLKDLTARPGTPAVPPGIGYFPSGHTATAAVAYGAAVLLLLPWLRTPRARRALVAAGAVLVLAVSYGLVRRGYHWPLDVLASWCLCTVLLSGLWLTLWGAAGRQRALRATESGTPPGTPPGAPPVPDTDRPRGRPGA